MCNKCNNNNNCGCSSQNPKTSCPCTETQEVTYICNQCQPEVDCDCAVKDLSTNCIIYDGDDLECSKIKKNTILTELIQQLDAFICEVKEELKKYFTLINIGAGKKIYAGDNLLGNKKLRTINKSGDLITVTEATEEIVIGLDEQELENTITELIPNYNAENVGTGSEIFKEEVSNTFKFKTLKSEDNSVVITEEENEIDLKANFKSCIKSSDKSIIVETDEKDNCTDLTICFETKTDIISVSQNPITNCHTLNIDIITEDGDSTKFTGKGDSLNPLKVDVVNLQKTIDSFPYQLSNSDDKYTIFVDNAISDVDIIIPGGLVDNFSCVFVQMGDGNVTIETLAANDLYYPATLQNVIKGQYYWAMVEKRQDLPEFYLLGSLKTI